MQLVTGLQRGTSGTLLPLAVDANGQIVIAGYDPADNANVVKSMQKKFRDSFPGTAVNTAKWDVNLAGGMTAAVSAGVLTFNSGVTASAESTLLSKETFTIPMRMTLALTLSQRIVNQEFWAELVSVNPVTGIPDGQNFIAWQFDGTNAAQAKYVVQNSGVTPLYSSLVTVNGTGGGGIYELEPFADESWFHSGGLDSTSARVSSYRRHQQSPDPNAVYKLRLRWKNGGTAPATATNAVIQYVCVTDYAELTAEITAGRGQSSSGQSMGVFITGGTVTSNEGTPLSPSTLNTNSAASTNAINVKTTAGNVYCVMVTNQGASPAYIKLYNKASAPVPGTDVPVQVIAVPATSTIQLDLGRVGIRFSSGIAFAITGALALADTTAVAAGQVQLTISYV